MYIRNSIIIVPLLLLSTFLEASVHGTVIKDLPFNGSSQNTYGTQESNELGIANITVTAYPGGSSTTTDSNGTWTLNTTGKVRIEFSDFPTFLKESSNSNSVQFINDGDTADFFLHNPSDYASSDNELATTHFINGKNSLNTPQPTLFSWPYSNRGDVNINQKTLSTTDDIRSIWGLAYNRSTKNLYSATFLRRHSSIGTDGLGQIYVTNLATDVTSAFITIPNVGTIADETTRGLQEADEPNTDADAFAKVAKVGLGDIEISEDESTLYVVNLYDKKIYEIDVASETITKSYDAPAATCTNGESRPFGLEFHQGSLHIGSVCDASSANCDTTLHDQCEELTAHVHKIPQGSTTSTEIFQMRLDYDKEQAADAGGSQKNWNPWTDTYANLIIPSQSGKLLLPVPVLSGITFDKSENLYLAFSDRTSMQGGRNQNNINGSNLAEQITFGAGDILKVTNTNGTYTINDYDFIDDRAPTTTDDHNESAVGAVALLKGSDNVIFTQYDNIEIPLTDILYTKGVTFVNQNTGDRTGAYRLTQRDVPVFFGKSMGIGDLELISNSSPLEIGNRVWSDDNSNCIQDNNESGIDGVEIKLFQNSILQATTTTNNGGIYRFSNLTPNTNYLVRIVDLNQTSLAGKTLTTCNSGGGEGNNRLLNNNDAILNGTSVEIDIAATDIQTAGANNNSFDLGFKPSNLTPTLYTLGDRVWVDSNSDGIQDNNESGYDGVTVTLYNNADCTGNELNNTTTANGGAYQFSNLLAGTYCLTFTNLPAEHNISASKQGTNTSLDSDANSNGLITDINLTSNDNTQDVGLSPNSVVVNTTTYTLGDRVWIDSNSDGIQDNNESGYDGVTVTLYNNDDCTGSVLNNTTTANGGAYQFSNLLTGTYCLSFTNLPADHNISAVNQGTSTALDSNANSNGLITDINLTANDATQDVGLSSPTAVLAVNHGNGSCTCHPYETKSVSASSPLSILLLIFITLLIASRFKDKL